LKRNIPKAFGLKTFAYHGYNHGLALIFQLVASIFVARNLGPYGLGELAIIQTILILLKPLLDVGTKSYLLRELVESPTIESQLEWGQIANKISTTFSLIILSISIFAILTLEQLIPSIVKPDLWIYCISFVAICNIFEHKGYTQILLLKDTKAYLTKNLFINIVSATTKLLGALTIESPNLLIALFFTATGVEHLLRGLFNKIELQSQINTCKLIEKSNEKSKRLLKESLHHLPSEIALTSETQLPRMWLAGIDNSTLGNFSVAQKNGIIFRTINKISHDSDLINPSLKVGVKYATLGTFLSAIAAPIIPYVYGSSFANATYYAYLLIPYGFLTIVGSKVFYKLIRNSMTKSATRINILGFVISLVLCSSLMPTYQVVGATIALSTSWIIQICLGLWLLKKNKTIRQNK
jgi:O-antigen/teichoic acid export membrane protein